MPPERIVLKTVYRKVCMTCFNGIKITYIRTVYCIIMLW